MNLLTMIIEASRTSEYPRLNKRAAENVLRCIAEWLENDIGGPYLPGLKDAARAIRDDILISRKPK